MEPTVCKILKIEPITHNVKRFTIEKPADLTFVPGQAADVSINLPEWKEQLRPFTFTGLNDWKDLEFTIKIYNDHKGVTEQLGKLKAGDALVIHGVFGAIHYYGEGTFIAGGAGVTPFIAIFRQLKKENKLGKNTLVFSNKTEKDIILKDEFTQLLNSRFINTLDGEKSPKYDFGTIDKKYLSAKINDFGQYFYICGPDPMLEAIQKILVDLGARKERVIMEKF